MPRIAIMQGRLLPPQNGQIQSFPRERWREEFPAAAELGLHAIEWIYDLQGADVNPLAEEQGISELRGLSRQYAVQVVSLCADYFMDCPFVTATNTEFAELTRTLLWLLERCHLARIRRIVLPFVDNASIANPEHEACVVKMLRQVLPRAEELGIELHLETSLSPHVFASLLAKLPHPMLRVNYDSGNSCSLGYNRDAEIAAYGHRVGSVHIKDRIRGGATVPLGEGDVNIPALLASLATIPYNGDYVLQVARGDPGNEYEWTRANLAFLLRHLKQAAPATAYAFQ